MPALLIKLALAPALMAASSLAARRWGPQRGGIVSAFPAIAGPLLLVTYLEHGAPAAAQAGSGTVLGLVALAAFCTGYAATAHRHGWLVSLAVGWLAAALVAAAVSLWALDLGRASTALIACGTLLLAIVMLRRLSDGPGQRASGRPGIAVRALITGLLVVGLASAVSRLGATAGGLLAALPVLASLLAVFTHRDAGAASAIELLRGTLIGMAGFVAFCELVVLMIVPDGAAAAFTAATAAALLLQAGLEYARAIYPAARNSAGRSGEASASARFKASEAQSAA